ncbi:MAG TPA: hypothetical protein VFZ53_27025 [Polyangiaceae bacterium]
MLRLRSALAVLGLVAACRALPSSIPLADTGEGRAFEDGALSRNRVPLVQGGAREAPADDEDDDDADETITVQASRGDAGDAGVPEAGVAVADAAAGSGWAGEYFGSDRHVRRMTGLPDDVALDDKAHTRVEESSPGALVISLVSSADGQVICALRARAEGNAATIEAGESCPGLMLMPPLSIEGTAELAGDRLEVSLEGHGEFPAEDRTLDVDVEYRFEGKRR